MNEFIDRFNRLLGHRQFFSSKDLVKLGIFGSKSSVWRAVKLGYIEAIWIGDRRRVILKDSVIEHIRRKNGRK